MKNNWKEEFYKVFEINQGSGRINGYITKNVGEDYSRPATVEDFEMYVEALLEEQKKEFMEEYKDKIQKYKSYYNPVGDELNKGKHIACDDLLESLNHHD